jgi:hypothetical protein
MDKFYKILISIIVIIAVIAFIFMFILDNYELEQEEELENFYNIENTTPNEEINNLNNKLNNYYQTQEEISKQIVLNQDSNNQNNFKNTDMNFHLIGHNNLLNVDNVAYDKFKNLYAHQIECPCKDGKVVGFDSCNNNLDTFYALNESLKQHDNRKCVTCNFLTEEQKKNDYENTISNKLIDQNIQNFSNHRSYSNQNSNMGENAIDRINECRTGETCNLNKFGNTIWQAYDNLLSNSFSKYQTTTNPNLLSGVNGDILKNDYQSV